MIIDAKRFFTAKKVATVNSLVAGNTGISTSESAPTTSEHKLEKEFKEFLSKVEGVVDRISKKVASILRKWLVIGILLLIVAKIVPEFPEQYPMIYQLGTAGLDIVEFIYKTLISFFGALTTGNMSCFTECGTAFHDAIVGIFEWVANIHF